ncbi:MAG: hypothetical protein N3B16_10985 [Candidatus Aminicenantes bacterium]|nr:hypothetical protein [Candidatus Aminicenantes bacterium]
MKKRIMFLGWLLIISAQFVLAQNYGLGFIFVEPTGLTGKMWLANRQSLSGAIGWASQKDNPLVMQFDYLPPSFHLLSDVNLQVNFYYGIGGRLLVNSGTEGGFRFPLGFDFLVQKAPLNFFFEIVPILLLSPEAKLNLKGAIGIRYIFK